jgi:hypothetical protein
LTPLSEHRNTPYIRGDTGGGRGYIPTPTTDRGMPHNIVPEGFTYGYQQVINNGMWITLFVYSNFVLVYTLSLYPQTIRYEHYKN